MKNTIIKDALVLFAITLIAGFALGLAHEGTADAIAAANLAKESATYEVVYPEAASFAAGTDLDALVEEANETAADWGYGRVTIDGAYEALDGNGNVIGYIINTTSSEGFDGDISISIGVSADKLLTGLGFLSISETPGMGMKANEDEFKSQFPGKDASEELSYIKSGEANEHQFDYVTGASVTSGAVTNALNAAVYFLNNYILG